MLDLPSREGTHRPGGRTGQWRAPESAGSYEVTAARSGCVHDGQSPAGGPTDPADDTKSVNSWVRPAGRTQHHRHRDGCRGHLHCQLQPRCVGAVHTLGASAGWPCDTFRSPRPVSSCPA